MKTWMTATMAVGVIGLAGLGFAQAQGGKGATVSSKKSTAPAKEANDVNTRGKTMEAPTAKGGKKTRAKAEGVLHIDNRTQWKIRIYVDGDYQGTVGPFGDMLRRADPESYKVEGVALFDDGSTLTWGPTSCRVPSGGEYTLKLN